MRNKISNDSNVDSKWKILNKVLYYGFVLFMTLGFLARMHDKENNTVSFLYEFVHRTFIVLFILWVILSITFFIKPQWFYKKEVE